MAKTQRMAPSSLRTTYSNTLSQVIGHDNGDRWSDSPTGPPVLNNQRANAHASPANLEFVKNTLVFLTYTRFNNYQSNGQTITRLNQITKNQTFLTLQLYLYTITKRTLSAASRVITRIMFPGRTRNWNSRENVGWPCTIAGCISVGISTRSRKWRSAAR